MGFIEVKAKIGREGDSMVIKYDLGESIEDLTNQFGESVIAQQARGGIVIALQSFMRSFMRPDENGHTITGDELQQKCAEWKPGTRARGKTVAEKTVDMFRKLSPDQQAQILEQLVSDDD